MATPSTANSSEKRKLGINIFDNLIKKLEEQRDSYSRNILTVSTKPLDALYGIAANLVITTVKHTRERFQAGTIDPVFSERTSRLADPAFIATVNYLGEFSTCYLRLSQTSNNPNPLNTSFEEKKIIYVKAVYSESLEALLETFLRRSDLCLQEYQFWLEHVQILETIPIVSPNPNNPFEAFYFYSIFFKGVDIPGILRIATHIFDGDQQSFDGTEPVLDLSSTIMRLQKIQDCLNDLQYKSNNFSAFLLLSRLYTATLSCTDPSVLLEKDNTPERMICINMMHKVVEGIQKLIPIERLQYYPLVKSYFDRVMSFHNTAVESACMPHPSALISEKPSKQRRLVSIARAAAEPFKALEYTDWNQAAKGGKETLRKYSNESAAALETLKELSKKENLLHVPYSVFQMIRACDILRSGLNDSRSLIAKQLISFENLFADHLLRDAVPNSYALLQDLKSSTIEDYSWDAYSRIFFIYEAELFQVAFNAVNKIIPKNICSVQLREEGMVFSIHSDEKAYLAAALKAIGRLEGFRSNISKKTITLAFSQATRRNLKTFLNALKTNLQNAYGRLIADQAPIVNMPATPSIPAEEKQKLQAQYAKEETEQNILEAKRKAQAVTIASTELDTIAPLTSSEEEKTTPSVPFADILTVEALLQVNLRRELRDILNNSKAYPPSTPAYHVQTGQLHMYVVPAADTLREMTEAERMILAEKRETGREFVLDKFPGQGWLFRMKAGGDRRLAGYYLPESHTVTLEAGSAVVVTLDREWDHDRGLRGV